jgi:hypothetical protein
VNENVRPIFPTDKPISLGVVEPFHSSLQTFHVPPSAFSLVLFGSAQRSILLISTQETVHTIANVRSLAQHTGQAFSEGGLQIRGLDGFLCNLSELLRSAFNYSWGTVTMTDFHPVLPT